MTPLLHPGDPPSHRQPLLDHLSKGLTRSSTRPYATNTDTASGSDSREISRGISRGISHGGEPAGWSERDERDRKERRRGSGSERNPRRRGLSSRRGCWLTGKRGGYETVGTSFPRGAPKLRVHGRYGESERERLDQLVTESRAHSRLVSIDNSLTGIINPDNPGACLFSSSSPLCLPRLSVLAAIGNERAGCL